MKEAKKFLKAKGLKDTLYNVNYNPNQNRGLPEKEWTKGGLSALLDEYAEWKVKNLSPNPVLSVSVCLHCKGKGTVNYKNQDYECPVCHGDGKAN